MYKSYKFRIYPNEQQQLLFNHTFGCVRFIYNRMLADKESYYKENKKHLDCSPSQYKDEFPFLKDVDGCALNWASIALTTAYMNYHKRKTNMPTPKLKSDRGGYSYTTSRTRGNIKFVDGYVQLPKAGLVKIVKHREIPEGYDLKSVTVSKTPSGKFFASVMFEYQEVIIPVEPVKFIGLDWSPRELYVTSENVSAEYPQYHALMSKKLFKEYKILDKCERGSNNHEKQRIKVAKLYEKVTNQRKDFIRKKAKELADNYDCVCVEDLSMKEQKLKSKQPSNIVDSAFGTFLKDLEYKLNMSGKQLVKVGIYYPSSKTCHCCGNKKKNMPTSIRTYVCKKCGTVIDRDYNAALNLKREGERIVLQTAQNKPKPITSP